MTAPLDKTDELMKFVQKQSEDFHHVHIKKKQKKKEGSETKKLAHVREREGTHTSTPLRGGTLMKDLKQKC